MSIESVITAIGNAVPVWLRKAVAYGLGAGIAMICVVFAFLSFPMLRDYIKEKLPMPTAEEVAAVTDSTASMSDDEKRVIMFLTARETVNMAMDSSRAAQDSLFAIIRNDLLEPGIMKLNGLERQVRHLNELMGVSNTNLQMQSQVIQQSTDRIGEMRDLMIGDETKELLRESLERQRISDINQKLIMKRLKIDRVEM